MSTRVLLVAATSMFALAALIVVVTMAYRAGRSSQPAPAPTASIVSVTEASVAPSPRPPPPSPTEIIAAEARSFSALRGDALAASLEDWATRTTEVPYAQLERNADAFFGEAAVFQGRIEEIHDYPGGTMLRLSIGAYGTDVLWIETSEGCTADRSLVANSRARVYGYLAGTHTYDTQAGWTMTLPAMLAIAVVPSSVPRHVQESVRARFGQ